LFWHLIYSNYFGVKPLCDPIFKCCSSLNKNDIEEFNEEKNYSDTLPGEFNSKLYCSFGTPQFSLGTYSL